MTLRDSLARYPLFDALRDRRSRRFGLGMHLPDGPLKFESRGSPVPLTEEEEAVLAFAACGVTGPALAELNYASDGGGAIMAGLLGRTAGSGDAIQCVSLFVIHEGATYWMRRPRDFEAGDVPEIIELARTGELTELYRRSRVELRPERAAPPLEPMYNLAVNQWSLYDPSSTYFLPVAELTHLYINGVLEILGEQTGAFIVDERAGFGPAGLARFAKSRGGHLFDDPRDERVITIQQLESLVTEFVTIEQGMILQNLALAVQAMGLGGFPHWAAHPYGWLQALGFEMERWRSSRYLGMGRILSALARLSGRDPHVELAVRLEHDGELLLKPYCPPSFANMDEAVRAVVAVKFGESGIFRGGADRGAWKDPESIRRGTQPPSSAAIEATIAYCSYVYDRYRRFPAYPPPFRTVLGFQAGHLDLDFYRRLYRPGSLSPTQSAHMEEWH